MVRGVMKSRNEFPQKSHEMPAPVPEALSKATKMEGDVGEHDGIGPFAYCLSLSLDELQEIVVYLVLMCRAEAV